ncbi:MAG: hypothetical protein CVV13_05545 [Gammaproteobacteria bacterium HGW-Gammaproteobacteria-3]|nr:MAG: hypothetical protein CVV13_05545 [Gammaproteobacteria bacterium HGW-Gammaproteobacteria-3]
MLTLNKTHFQPGVIALMILMAATRFHHVGTPFALADASLAVFFLGGLWFGGLGVFAVLLLEAGLIDYVAVSQFNVSDFCISPAYVFLLPTYAALWFGGKSCAYFKTLTVITLMSQISRLTLSIAAAFLISNGSFNVLSGRYSAITGEAFFDGAVTYFPAYFADTAFYVVIIFAGVKLLSLLPGIYFKHNAA